MIEFSFIVMKTVFTILKWVFGLAALPMILVGFLFPMMRGSGDSENVFYLLLAIPFVLLAMFFHSRAKKENGRMIFSIYCLSFLLQRVEN